MMLAEAGGFWRWSATLTNVSTHDHQQRGGNLRSIIVSATILADPCSRDEELRLELPGLRTDRERRGLRGGSGTTCLREGSGEGDRL